MEVQEVLKHKGSDVLTVKPTQVVSEALAIMIKQKIGALLVVGDRNEIAGIISERDILRETHQEPEQFGKKPIKSVMTKKLIVASPTDKIDYLMGIMTNNRIRHIPIVVKGKLYGLLSIGDVVKALLQDSEYENQYLKEYMFGGPSAEEGDE
jgi:CBS domain-containing protein